jgi:drug/metabolite transporter (DMT)-like permease
VDHVGDSFLARVRPNLLAFIHMDGIPRRDESRSPAGDTGAVRRGILWMIVATMMFVNIDAIAKHLVVTYPVLQVVWGRYFFHLLFLVVFLGRRIPVVLKTRRLSLQLGRSALLGMATFLMTSGLRFIPLADAITLLFLVPLMVTVLSGPFLGERVGLRRWMSVSVGFLGALVIIRPGTGMMQMAALFPIGAAVASTFYQIATRILVRTDTPMTTILYTALLGALVLSAIVPFVWVTPTPIDFLMMVASGVLGGVGHFLLIKAFTAAPAATVSPFTYVTLIWSVTYGFIFFGDLPDAWTWAGAAIIVGSGFYALHRENGRGA